MPTDEMKVVFEKWNTEVIKNGLHWEVLNDIVDAFFNKHPDECLTAMHESMMDWDM